MNIFSFIAKEANSHTPILTAEQIQSVVARFAVRGNGFKNGEASANRQYPGITAELAAESRKSAATVARETATTATGALATGGEYSSYAATVEAISDAAMTKTTEVAVSAESPETSDMQGGGAMAIEARAKIAQFHSVQPVPNVPLSSQPVAETPSQTSYGLAA